MAIVVFTVAHINAVYTPTTAELTGRIHGTNTNRNLRRFRKNINTQFFYLQSVLST